MAQFNLSEALESLPEVPPELRNTSGTRDLFVMATVSRDFVAICKQRGWAVKDVRLLEGGDRVRGTLAGLGTGTINPDLVDLKQLELDARVHGLLGRDSGEDKEKKTDLGAATLEALLDLGESRFVPSSAGPLVVPEARKGGRPRGSKNKPRPPTPLSPLDQVKEALKQ